MTARLAKIIAFSACTALAATPVLAEKAAQLTYINGNYAKEAEGMLRDRGFSHVSTNKNSMGYIYSYWWDGSDKNCVVVETYNGQVMTINDASDQDCGHHKGGGDAAAAVGVVAGAAILGALLSHKSNHHENKQHYTDYAQEQQYERGYNDGLHNVAYHNYDRSDSYSSGYQAGVQQRQANTSYHHGKGGYHPVAQYADLQGARAAGGMDEMSRRGFVQVDNFTSGNTRYSIQYKRDTNQCVQVTIADGHFYDLRDIGQHPNCR
ncbi:hypothetical protein [Qipengyuania sp. RANM35]|uniref:hypothetical protein n=1 Tax=Qipengyuania sp. RANM35 TaxID=3068635 RepID=UPI0034DAF66E